MIVSELSATIALFLFFLVLAWKDERLLNVVGFFFFMFVYIKLDSEFVMVATFYALFFLFYMGISFTKQTFAPSKSSTGMPYFVRSLAVGGFVYIFIALLSVQTGFRIVGTPPLLISWDFLKPSVSIILAFVENRVFITLYILLKMILMNLFGALGIVASVFSVSLLFSIFHGFLGVGSFIWAFVIMAVWIVVYELFGMLPLDISHGLNNAIVELRL